MRTGQFHYQAVARCTSEQALAVLADLTRQGELHNLVIRVEETPAAPGAVRSYAITDRLAWGPFHFTITYVADILSVSASQVITVARQRPSTTVRNVTTLHDHGDTVTVDVEITLTAPTVLFAYALRQAKLGHAGVAARLPAALEAG